MRIVGLVSIFTLLLLAMGNVPAFIDVPSMLIVIGGTIALLLFGGNSIPAMCKAAFSGSASDEVVRAGAYGWRMARNYSLAAAGFGAFIGSIIMLKNMDDPAAIGPGMALVLLTTLYAMIVAFVISLPLQAHLEKRIQGEVSEQSILGSVLGALLLLLMPMFSFFVLLLSFSGAE